MILVWKITNNYWAKLMCKRGKYPDLHWKIETARNINYVNKYFIELQSELERNKNRLIAYKKECESSITLPMIQKALKWKSYNKRAWGRIAITNKYKKYGAPSWYDSQNRKEYLRDWMKFQYNYLTDYGVSQSLKPMFEKLGLESIYLNEIPKEIISKRREQLIIKRKLQRLRKEIGYGQI